MSKATILIVEDEQDIRELLSFNLERDGYTVLQAADGKKGLEIIKMKKPDLILLDIMLPELDGLSVCKELSRDINFNTPIIMLTARGEDIDRILGLELGADDYVVKPFNVRELLLRIKAVLRRKNKTSSQEQSLSRNGLVIDIAAHSVSYNGNNINLTITEFRLLEDLVKHAGLVRSREELLSHVWGYHFEGYARTVDTHVRRLRMKLEDAADMIETIRGIGYRFIS